MGEAQTLDVAVLGATGAVGEVIVDLLQERGFPVGRLYPLASGRSLGNKVRFGGRYLNVDDAGDFDFTRVQLAFFAAGAEAAARYAPQAEEAGCLVIDTSPAFRDDEDVPLVVPEVNAAAIGRLGERRLVASPGGATIPLLVVLKPLMDAVGVDRVNVTACRAVSADGQAAVRRLAGQTIGLLNMRATEGDGDQAQMAFNVLAQSGRSLDNGYTREEMEMVREARKVLGEDEVAINPTVVTVPVFFGHSLAVHLETRARLGAGEARELLRRAPGIELLEEGECPSAAGEAAGRDAVFVGRVREDISHPFGLDLWVVTDNVRKGAALNSVQIAEILLAEGLI